MTDTDLDDDSREDARAVLPMIRLHLATLYHPAVPEILLEKLGSLDRVFEFLEGVDRKGAPDEWISSRRVKRLVDPGWRQRAECELELCTAHDIGIRLRHAADWPHALLGLEDMPLALFSQGEWRHCDTRAVGIVGSRKPSPYGVRQARRFARELAARGVTVVSGLARGIDAEAHEAALEAGGRTIAVLGSGLGCIYPASNRWLARTIAESGRGCVVTEFPFDCPPRRHHFPQRNRLISGLSSGLLVVEAGEKSGTLVTVDWTLRQGRAVWAVPGRIDDPEARGCVRLLQSGAYAALDPAEIVEALFGEAMPASAAAETPSRRGHDRFLERLRPLLREQDAWHPDEVCARLGLPASDVVRELARLAAAGRLERVAGGRYVLGDRA